MSKRIQLHFILVDLLGSSNVYFQPPSTIKMDYPCIVYKLADIDTRYANNKLYTRHKKYKVSIIDKNPDSVIPDKLSKLPLCKFDTAYTMDNLNHYVYNLYY